MIKIVRMKYSSTAGLNMIGRWIKRVRITFPTITSPKVHFTESSFHRQFISPTITSPTIISPTIVMGIKIILINDQVIKYLITSISDLLTLKKHKLADQQKY